ncbi:MAG: saccharopine dehydrogenase-like NADP-dependent oxidoreductase, partial [Limisphaerales bacterium]
SMVVTGDDAVHTAMAKTVGLPLGIAARHVLQGTIAEKGIVMPTIKPVYSKLLPELEENGIRFKETEFVDRPQY